MIGREIEHIGGQQGAYVLSMSSVTDAASRSWDAIH